MKAKSSYSIYRITSPEGKVYIGATCCADPRARYQYGHGYRSNPRFWDVIQRYGWGNFTAEVLERGLSLAEAKRREEYYIRLHDSCDPRKGYNRTAASVLAYASMRPADRAATARKQSRSYYARRAQLTRGPGRDTMVL